MMELVHNTALLPYHWSDIVHHWSDIVHETELDGYVCQSRSTVGGGKLLPADPQDSGIRTLCPLAG